MPRRRMRQRFVLNADVNVVSLIDVMLLLLVIFMITAPMMQGGVDIALPQAQAKPLQSNTGLTITISKTGDIMIGDEHVTAKEFPIIFGALPANRTKNGVYLRVDKDVRYEVVVQVLAVIKADGVTDVGLVADPEEKK
jgi:biopolymer transport protein ExbD/biopolymer transport protein TolR